MNVTELQRKLIAAAKHAPSDRVPYAFEKRVMANLAAESGPDLLTWWGRGLWRGAAASVGLCLLLSVWSVLASRPHAGPESFSEELEQTILASVHDSESTW